MARKFSRASQRQLGFRRTHEAKDGGKHNVQELIGITAECILARTESSRNETGGANTIRNEARCVEVGISATFEL